MLNAVKSSPISDKFFKDLSKKRRLNHKLISSHHNRIGLVGEQFIGCFIDEFW